MAASCGRALTKVKTLLVLRHAKSSWNDRRLMTTSDR